MRCLRANVIRVRAKSSLQAGYITAVLSNFKNTTSIAKWGSPYKLLGIQMDRAVIQAEFERIEKFLFDPKNWKPVLLTRQWASEQPKDAGVYMLFENNNPVYVGESGSISGRIRDMLDSRHHTVRRSLGELRFSNISGYEKASSKSKHPDHIEQMIVKTMQSFKLCALPINIGRKEFEEFVFAKHNPELNRKSKRGASYA